MCWVPRTTHRPTTTHCRPHYCPHCRPHYRRSRTSRHKRPLWYGHFQKPARSSVVFGVPSERRLQYHSPSGQMMWWRMKDHSASADSSQCDPPVFWYWLMQPAACSTGPARTTVANLTRWSGRPPAPSSESLTTAASRRTRRSMSTPRSSSVRLKARLDRPGLPWRT